MMFLVMWLRVLGCLLRESRFEKWWVVKFITQIKLAKFSLVYIRLSVEKEPKLNEIMSALAIYGKIKNVSLSCRKSL